MTELWKDLVKITTRILFNKPSKLANRFIDIESEHKNSILHNSFL